MVEPTQHPDSSDAEEPGRRRSHTTWWVVGAALAVVLIVGGGTIWAVAARQSSAASPTATSGARATETGQTLNVTGKSSAPANRDNSKFKLDAARAVLLTKSDSSKVLYIINPVVTTRSPARIPAEVLNASPKTFKIDNRECLPLLLAQGSVSSLRNDPEPSSTVYLMQDEQSDDAADGPDILVSQSSRTLSTTAPAAQLTNAIATSLDDCDEALIQTSKSSEPISQEFDKATLTGARYVTTAYLASVTNYTDASATAVLRRGNLVTTVTVQTATASHKRLLAALARAVSLVDAKMSTI